MPGFRDWLIRIRAIASGLLPRPFSKRVLANEQIAVKTDRPNWFVQRKREALREGQLLPIPPDTEKSGWAYSAEVTNRVPTLDTHAAAMLIWSSQREPRSTVGGVHFARAAARPEWIGEDRDEHVVEAFDHYHRSIHTLKAGVALGMLETCPFEEWHRSRAELVPIIRDWLNRGVVRTSLRDVAQRLVDAES
jgi:hypothetical protein